MKSKLRYGSRVIYKPTGQTATVTYITPYDCGNPINILCDGEIINCEVESLILVPNISEERSQTLYRSVMDEMSAHEVYVNTGADRGGKNGTKGKAFQKWMEAREIVKKIMKEIEYEH